MIDTLGDGRDRHRAYLYLSGFEARRHHYLTLNVLEVFEAQPNIDLVLLSRDVFKRTSQLPALAAAD